MTTAATSDLAPALPTRSVAWVDGVGAFLLLTTERVTLGGLQQAGDSPGESGIVLAADLARNHAAICRSGEGYWLEAFAPVAIAGKGRGRVVSGRTNLHDDEELLLYREGRDAESSGVRLRFRQPHPLTATARLTPLGSRRTDPRYDGIILLADACVFGPGGDTHIRCRDAEANLLLSARPGGWWAQSSLPIEVNGKGESEPQAASHSRSGGPVRIGRAVQPGDHLQVGEISLRLES